MKRTDPRMPFAFIRRIYARLMQRIQPEDVLRDQLYDAEMDYLHVTACVEYYEAMQQMLEKRLARLRGEVRPLDDLPTINVDMNLPPIEPPASRLNVRFFRKERQHEAG